MRRVRSRAPRRRPRREVLLARAPALDGVAGAQLASLAARAQVFDLDEDEAPPRGAAAGPFVVDHGVLLAEGDDPDLIGRGGFRPHGERRPLRALRRSQLVALPDDTIDAVCATARLRLPEGLATAPADPLLLSARAQTIAEVARAFDATPAAVLHLLRNGGTAREAGDLLAEWSDAAMDRLVAVQLAACTPPPAPFALLVFGSQARREQGLHSDQDTGVAYERGPDAAGHRWFADFGNALTTGLERCGLRRCPGGVMASNPAWRHDVDGWAAAIRRWTDPSDPSHLVRADIGFDVRQVSGDLQVEQRLRRRIATEARATLVRARLARAATSTRPPTAAGVQLASAQPSGSVDVKARGLQLVVDVARVLTLGRGGTEVATAHRLAAAARDRTLPPELAGALREGVELLSHLRFGAQLAALARGEPVTSRLPPGHLTVDVRRRLRQVFRDIWRAQRLLATSYHLTAR